MEAFLRKLVKQDEIKDNVLNLHTINKLNQLDTKFF